MEKSLLLGLILITIFIASSGEYNETEVTLGKNFFVSSDKANLFQAYFNCKDAGMDLASINSQQDEEDLTYFLRKVDKSGNAGGGFWLSGTNLPNKNSTQFYWLTGGKRVIYTNWLAGEPNNSGGLEFCLEWAEYVTNTTTATGWNDMNCDLPLRYICQET